MVDRFNPLSDLDTVWSGTSSKPGVDSRFSNYYDYYFSGEDIKVYMDGLFEPEHELDIGSFAYAIKQEKQPIYGFWSYNYDSVLYGTRIITGEFSLFSRYPSRMTDLIKKATDVRSGLKPDGGKVVSPLRSKLESPEDEKNIQKYWAYSQLDRLTADPMRKEIIDSGHNIFSAHPPFNFVILYGVQEASLSPKDFSGTTNMINDNLDRMVASDVNDRLVRFDGKTNAMKVILQEVQLLGMTTSFVPGGQAVVENYQFIARDLYFSEVNLGFIKTQTPTNASDSKTATATSTASASNLNA